jgi:hypothetical protein
MRRPALLWHGDLDRSRDLIGQIVYCRRRHEADDGARRTVRDREEVVLCNLLIRRCGASKLITMS